MLQGCLIKWLMMLPFLPIATAVFTPFIRRVSTKDLKACILYSALIQVIAITCYCLVFIAIPWILFPSPLRPSLSEVYFAIFTASLIVGPAFSTMVASSLLNTKNTKDLKQIFIGNLWVFGTLWVVLRLLAS
jgi:hypothetical protein